MALTALEIFKHLPKTNCKACGVPTCLAFAMQLASKKAQLDQCPHISNEATVALESASAPPIKLVTIGTGEKKLEIGNETVLFRHEESFYHETGVAIQISDSLSTEELREKAKKINDMSYERVGFVIGSNLIALKQESGSAEKFASAAETVQAISDLPVILISSDAESMKAAAGKIKEKRPLLYGINESNLEAMSGIAAELKLPVVVSGHCDNLDTLAQKVSGAGVQDIILEPVSDGLSSTLSDLTRLRRAQLKKNFRAVGYPMLVDAVDTSDPWMQANRAACYVAKYASIVIISFPEDWQMLPLLTVRQNIFTDPRKPVQVEAGIWEVGDVNPNSPVLVTTNFSLTYYSIEGEVSASRVPSYIVVLDTEGTSVLTAWAAEKFTAEMIAEMLNKDGGIKEKVKHRKVIIPGLVAVLTSKLSEASGWDVLIGPREAMGISRYLKSLSIN